MTDLERAREQFGKDTFAAECVGIQIDEVREGYAKCSLKIESKHLNANKVPQGGVIFTLADYAFAVAANVYGDPSVSWDASVAYLTVAKGSTLYAEARVMRSGRKMNFYTVDVTDDLGTKVAFVTVSGVVVGHRGTEAHVKG